MRIAEVEDSTKYWRFPVPDIERVASAAAIAPAHDKEVGRGKGERGAHTPQKCRVVRVGDPRKHERRDFAASLPRADIDERRKRDNRSTHQVHAPSRLVVVEVQTGDLILKPGEQVFVDTEAFSVVKESVDGTEPVADRFHPPSHLPEPESQDYVVHLGDHPVS
jgi:hypothetical protein